ncbi:DNA-binding domain-containing protein [Emcibacter sp.]|uniref:HvfC/BufC N-terminal domain-containing protein n=1 Tax=Emcibacter sp. TaxID=1979954 RepID=UPI003A9169CB
MSSLKDLQQLFQASVLAGTDGILPDIAEGGRITPERRLAIYAHAYGARLRETLEKDFPALHAMLGDDQFRAVCDAYISAFPSDHPSLRFFGRHMAEFLRGDAFCDQPFLGEMAQFEWAFLEVFDSADRFPVTVEDVAALAPQHWTTLRFDFHPSLRLGEFAWNVPAVWSAVTQREDGGDIEQIMPQKNTETVPVMQWRHDMVSYFRSLERDEAETLERARHGADFPVLCEILDYYHGDNAPLKAAEYLKTWVSEGLICGFDHANFA